ESYWPIILLTPHLDELTTCAAESSFPPCDSEIVTCPSQESKGRCDSMCHSPCEKVNIQQQKGVIGGHPLYQG
ncbi:unnamed protein product, partial [Larinioides sclopetarius]